MVSHAEDARNESPAGLVNTDRTSDPGNRSSVLGSVARAVNLISPSREQRKVAEHATGRDSVHRFCVVTRIRKQRYGPLRSIQISSGTCAV